LRRGIVELPLAADRDQPVPLAVQVAGQLREAMVAGLLAAGERLPSTRALAATLGVSRTVASTAYAQLFAEGWIEGRHGSGTYVVPKGAQASSPARAPGAPLAAPLITGTDSSRGSDTGDGAQVSPVAPLSELRLSELRPGIPWTASIDRAAWRRAWRSAGAAVPASMPLPGRAVDPGGLAELRSALTGYLRRARGLGCAPGQVVVTRGVAGSLGLIAAALLRPGDRVGVEEPGYPAARAVFEAHGAELIPCRVDANGLVVDELPAGLRLVYTTPAHQYPLGGRLPVRRRQALVSWAHANNAVIVEDDYDGEFRYDVAPLPSLAGLDPEVVIYLGTTTKILTPAFRLGWLVAKPALAARLAEAAEWLGDWASEPAQRALLAMISAGDLERHIRRMRHIYGRRRAAMVAALRGKTAGRLLGDQAGMHMVLEIPQDAWAVAAAAKRRGVAVATLSRYFTGPVTRNGLVLGYGCATVPEVTRGCHVLAGILACKPGLPGSEPTTDGGSWDSTSAGSWDSTDAGSRSESLESTGASSRPFR
jgi:GntR family transcriptional regulator / MocR family aminotransferase